jgi:hypothetical protein
MTRQKQASYKTISEMTDTLNSAATTRALADTITFTIEFSTLVLMFVLQ